MKFPFNSSFKSRVKFDLLMLLAPFLLFLVGISFHPVALEMDMRFVLHTYVGIFSIFLGWSLSVFYWGQNISSIISFGKDSLFLKFGFGIVVMVMIVILFSFFKIMTYEYRYHLIFFCSLSSPLNLFLMKRKNIKHTHKLKTEFLRGVLSNSLQFLSLLIFLVSILAVFINSSLPQLQNDPLYYHLPFAKSVAEKGEISFGIKHIYYLMCSYWDYIYVWPQVLLGGAGGKGLVEAQIFSQWIHLVFGLFICSFGLLEILKKFDLIKRPEWKILSCYSIFYFYWFTNTAVQAKNDLGATFFALLGTSLFLSGGGKLAFFLSGLFFGLSISSKLAAGIYFFAFILIQEIYQRKKIHDSEKYKEYILLIVGVLVFFLPYLIRNYSLTGNPFFPQVNGIFKSDWYKIYRDFYSIGSFRELWAFIIRYLFNLKEYLVFNITIPLLFFTLYCFKKEKSKILKQLFWTCLIHILVFYIYASLDWEFALSSARFLGLSVIFTGFIPLVFIARYLDKKSAYLRSILFFSILGLLVNFSRIDYTYLYRFERFTSITEKIWFNHVGGRVKFWMLNNIPKNSVIVSDGDLLFYYVYELDLIEITQPYLYSAYEGKAPAQTYALLEKMGVDYIYHAGLPLWITEFGQKLEKNVLNHPKSILYADGFSMIVDLRILNDLMGNGRFSDSKSKMLESEVFRATLESHFK